MKRVPVIIQFVEKLWPNWVGARVQGRTIYWVESTPLNVTDLAHELCHVLQSERLGWRFLFAYVIGFVLAGFSYENNKFEVEAREAESDPFFLSWARDVMQTLKVAR